MRGDFADRPGFIVRVDNTAAFSTTLPHSNSKSLHENQALQVTDSRELERAESGIHFEMMQRSNNVLLRWRKPNRYALLEFSSQATATMAYEAFTSGLWTVSNVRGGLLPRVKYSKDRPLHVFLGSVPYSTTKADILTSIPSSEHYPVEIFLSACEVYRGVPLDQYIFALCKQIGPLSFRKPRSGDANTRNVYAVASYHQAHVASTAARMMAEMPLPLSTQNMHEQRVLHCVWQHDSHFYILPAVHELAKAQLRQASVEWGNIGVKVHLQRQVRRLPTRLGGKPSMNLHLFGGVSEDVTVAGNECARILSSTMVPVGLGDKEETIAS